METSLMSLPSELLATILANLSIESLLNFSATCRTNQMLAYKALHTLNLAVFPGKIHCSMALMSKKFQNNTEYSVSDDMIDTLHSTVSKTTGISTRLLPKGLSPTARREEQIGAQNEIAADILGKKSLQSLRSLSLQIYDLRSSKLASVMATNLADLRHLELRFSHPYVHDCSLSAGYWHQASSGTPAWNALVGFGTENSQKLRMRGLFSLHIERAGLTSAQLRKFVESNPLLRRLHLDNVTGVDLEFVQWLAMYCESGESRLEEITFEKCPQLRMQRLEDFAWLAGITESEVNYLSLYKCRNIRHEILVELMDQEDSEEGLDLDLLETLIPPNGPVRHFGVVEENSSKHPSLAMQTGFGAMAGASGKIDIDPEYLASPTTA